MFKYALIGIGILNAGMCLAQEISYADLSKSLLNTEIVRSPVYSKTLHRDIRAQDTANYKKESARLKAMKDKRTLSDKEYNKQKSTLDRAYNRVYGQENLVQQGAVISQDPVNSLYNDLMKNNKRTQLQSLSQPDLLKELKSMPGSTETTTANAVINPVVTKAPAPQGSRGMANVPRVRAPIGSVGAASAQNGQTTVVKRNKVLGERSIPINLSAFK